MKHKYFTSRKISDSSSHKKGNLSCFLKIAEKVKGKGYYNRDIRERDYKWRNFGSGRGLLSEMVDYL